MKKFVNKSFLDTICAELQFDAGVNQPDGPAFKLNDVAARWQPMALMVLQTPAIEVGNTGCKSPNLRTGGQTPQDSLFRRWLVGALFIVAFI